MLLGVAVVALCVVTGAFVFYPRLSRWLGPSRVSVVGEPPSPTEVVPVWLSRGPDGVALLIEPLDGDTDPGLQEAFGPGRHFLLLHVYNFAHAGRYVLELPAAGFASPEGGAPARPAAAVLPADLPAPFRPVVTGLGAVGRLEVEKGHAGQALLVIEADPARRTAFVSGDLRFERREVQLGTLASWRQAPDWAHFEDLR